MLLDYTKAMDLVRAHDCAIITSHGGLPGPADSWRASPRATNRRPMEGESIHSPMIDLWVTPTGTRIHLSIMGATSHAQSARIASDLAHVASLAAKIEATCRVDAEKAA